MLSVPTPGECTGKLAHSPSCATGVVAISPAASILVAQHTESRTTGSLSRWRVVSTNLGDWKRIASRQLGHGTTDLDAVYRCNYLHL